MIRLFRVFIPVSTFTLFVAEILLTTLSFLGASYVLADVDPTDYLFYDGGIMAILAVAGIFVLGLYFSGLYSGVYVKSRIVMLYQLFLVTGLTFLVEGLISSLASKLRLPVRVMVLGSILSASLIYAWRLFFSRYAGGILGSARVLLVGTDPVVEALGCYIDSHPQSGLLVTGCVVEDGSVQESVAGAPKLGYMRNLPNIIGATLPNHVVVGTQLAATAEFARVLEELRYAGQNIQDAAETYERVCGRVWVRGIPPAELIYARRYTPPVRHVWVQGFLGTLVALVGLIVFLPVMILMWVFLRVRLSGPVLVSEPRVGLKNKPFRRYRFRPPGTKKGDALGGVLETIVKFHLDELPQLVNILKGDMAFVGPRPERPEFVDLLTQAVPYYPQRHCVRPGMTGWAQIQETDSAEESLTSLEYDLYYIKNMSMSLDAIVVFQALRCMFLQTPAE